MRQHGIDYTANLSALMQDIVVRLPELQFIDLSRVLVFARPGRSEAEGANASCHCLALPTSDPGYFFWRDRVSGTVTRRSEWFVTKSPEVRVTGKAMNYLISFALPRFTDQSLRRSRKRVFYDADTPDWVGKLDTVIHELYHIDPAQDCLRRFASSDGTVCDALHSVSYGADIAALVRAYLASAPDPRLLEFLHHDFAGLRARLGAVRALTFRSYPSYPRRYREVVADLPLPSEIERATVEPVIDTSTRLFRDDDLQWREFTGATARAVEPRPLIAA